jgi:hypothetical protein
MVLGRDCISCVLTTVLGYHPTITLLSPDYHPTITLLSPDYHPTITLLSPYYYSTITLLLPYYHPTRLVERGFTLRSGFKAFVQPEILFRIPPYLRF